MKVIITLLLFLLFYNLVITALLNSDINYKNCILVMLRMITALYVGILNYKYSVFIDPERNLECCVCLLNMTLCTLLCTYNIKQYLPIFNHTHNIHHTLHIKTSHMIFFVFIVRQIEARQYTF